VCFVEKGAFGGLKMILGGIGGLRRMILLFGEGRGFYLVELKVSI